MKASRALVLFMVLLLSLALVTVVFAAVNSSRAGVATQQDPPPPKRPGSNPYTLPTQPDKAGSERTDLSDLGRIPSFAQGIVPFSSSPGVTITDDTYIGILDGNDGFGPDAGMVCDGIDTSGVFPFGAAMVEDVSLEFGMEHTWIGDLSVKLRSPAGTILAVMERVQGDGVSNNTGDNGTNAPFGDSTNITATFPIQFGDIFPTDSELMGTGLTNTQTVCQDDGVCDYFPNPDQALITGTSVADFSAYAGEDPSGQWTLCVGDGAAGDIGTLEHWTLNLDVGDFVLATSAKRAPDVVTFNDPITYTIELRNIGATTVANASLVDPIPLGATFIPGSLSCSSGTCNYDPGTNEVTWQGDIPPMSMGGGVLETFTHAWQITNSIGMVYNPDLDLLRYAHESQPNPTIFDVENAPPHTLLNSIQLSAVNPGFTNTLDNRTGAGYDPVEGSYFLPDFNGDLFVRDDNIVEVDAAGVILNAWETDGAGNDSYDASSIDTIIDIAVVPDNPLGARYFAAASADGSTVYAIDLVRAGQFVTNTWATFYTCGVPGLGDNVGIDYDSAHGVLYHSDLFSNLIVATDLGCNVVNTFVCPGPAGFNTGVTYVEGSNPEAVLVTDFASNTTTRCTTGASKVTLTFAVEPTGKGSVHNEAIVNSPDLMAPFLLEADTLVTHECETPDNPVDNCSFETGDFTDWTPQDIITPLTPLQVVGPGFPPGFGFFTSDPTRGAFAAVNGFDGVTGTIRLSQDVVLPPGSASLEFDYRAAWDLMTFLPPGSQNRHFRVLVEPFGGGPPLQSTTVLTAYTGTFVPDTGNQLGVVDVVPFSGDPVRISFEWEIPNEFTGPAFFQLDNVFVRVLDADLELTKTDQPDPVFLGEMLTYELIVQNNGPGLATDVTITDTLPGAVSYLAAIPSQGTCSQLGDTVTCDLGALPPGANATVLIEVMAPDVEGPITNTAVVAAAEDDPDLMNNMVSEQTLVTPYLGYLPNVYK